jgi:hypothetical protein
VTGFRALGRPLVEVVGLSTYDGGQRPDRSTFELTIYLSPDVVDALGGDVTHRVVGRLRATCAQLDVELREELNRS